ncbi:MAG: ABC transporter ATP-binding protein [Bdellovibrionales bacterium]|nr:ABC transporter ATP-binding protein [Bdellovibrionales bacterium]
MSENAIVIENLVKRYRMHFWQKPFPALKGVSFKVPKHEVTGLIGPNGAGKTTAIKSMLNFVIPTSGKIMVFDRPSSDQSIRKTIGYLPEQTYYYEYLKADEILHFYGRFFSLRYQERKKRVDQLIDMVGLGPKKQLRLRNYSKGMLQRLGIAQALINDPDLVIFDEPMSGLDPLGRKDVKDIILRLKHEKKTILFSSHILSDVELLCDRVVMLKDGELYADGEVADLIRPEVSHKELVFKAWDQNITLPEAWQKHAKLRKVGNRNILEFAEQEEFTQEIVFKWVEECDHRVISFQNHRMHLEDLLYQKQDQKGNVST